MILFTKLTQFRGHTYLCTLIPKELIENASANSKDAGGYLFVVNDAFESEKIREYVRNVKWNNWIYINYYQDISS